jgi:hypothetical protein
MPTTAAKEEMLSILSTPKNLFVKTPAKSSPSSSLLLKDIVVATKDGWVCHSRIPELAMLELVFDLFASGVKSVPEILNECHLISMASQVCRPSS